MIENDTQKLEPLISKKDIQDRTYIEPVRLLYDRALGNRLLTLVMTGYVGTLLWIAEVTFNVLVTWTVVALVTNVPRQIGQYPSYK